MQHDKPIVRSQPLIRWGITIKFLVFFIVGIVLALGFAALVSFTHQEPLDERELYLFQTIHPTYLNLTLAGALGGLLYSMLVDQTLEFPSWAKDDAGLKPGFLGDIFVGIAGAFIAYIALPGALKTPANSLEEVGIMIFVTGLVGGYGGKYVLNAALGRLIQRIQEADLAKEKLETASQSEELQELANRQIYEGLNPEELSNLQNQLQSTVLGSDVKERIFNAARDARRLGSRVKSYESRIARAIPILEALVQDDPHNDKYHAQLACAYRDAAHPDFDAAIREFDTAIQLRKTSEVNNWRYELDRVLALIRKVRRVETSTNNQLESVNFQLKEKIYQDLQTIELNYGLARVFLEFDEKIVNPIKIWLNEHQAWLQKQPDGQTLLKLVSLSPVSPEPSIQKPTAPTTPIPPQPTPPTPIAEIKPDPWDTALLNCPTTGASSATASQDGLATGGTAASEKMAQTDWSKLEKYANHFYEIAVEYDVPPAIIAAICSRESRGGSALAADGTGDHGNAFGLMQVDKRFHTQAGSGDDPGGQSHLGQGTRIYADYRNQVRKQHPDWTDSQVLKGAAVAYNAGVKNVRSLEGMDRGTTGDDYGSDIIARAQFYAKKLKSLAECKAGKSQGMAVITSPSQRITALRDTFLKKQILQTSQLSADQKLAVAAGQTYAVEAYKKADAGHYFVKLADGEGEWYIYDSDDGGHWDTTWEGDEKETNPPVTPTETDGEVHSAPGSIDWKDSNQRISKYFTVGEVTLNDTRRRPEPNSSEEENILALVKELDKVREEWGTPIRVTSWYRPPAVNRAVGGASRSQHISGRAVDIQPTQGGLYKFQSWLDQNWHGALGYGAKRGFVHLDIRNGKGWKSGGPKGVRWNY